MDEAQAAVLADVLGGLTEYAREDPAKVWEWLESVGLTKDDVHALVGNVYYGQESYKVFVAGIIIGWHWHVVRLLFDANPGST